jgi:hypothetical protein
VGSTGPFATVTPSALNASAALPQVSSFGPTNILPLSAQLHDTPPPLPIVLPISHPVTSGDVVSVAYPAEMVTVPDLTQPPVSSRLGLDIDLSQEAEVALVPLPFIAVSNGPTDANGMGNLIEFDLDTPVSTAPAPQA